MQQHHQIEAAADELIIFWLQSKKNTSQHTAQLFHSMYSTDGWQIKMLGFTLIWFTVSTNLKKVLGIVSKVEVVTEGVL